MANDRIYFQCHCGEQRLLAKFWGYECELWQPETLDEWLTDHGPCDPAQTAQRMQHFELRFESELPAPDGPIDVAAARSMQNVIDAGAGDDT